MTQPSELQYRQTVAHFPSGVTVVTTHHNGDDIGLTVSAFASLSLSPPMVLVSIDSNSRSHEYLTPGSPIGVSVLAAHQTELAVQFARHGQDRFAGVNIERRDSIPFIADAAAWFSGEVVDSFCGGDHRILTVAVRACDAPEHAEPLLYYKGRLNPWRQRSAS